MSNFLTIDQIQTEIVVEFEPLETLEKYERLIEIGSQLPKISQKDKIPQNKVESCQSRTWLVLKNSPNSEETKPKNLEVVSKVKLKSVLENQNNEFLAKSQDWNSNLEGKYGEKKPENFQKLIFNSNLSLDKNNAQDPNFAALNKTNLRLLFFTGFSDSQLVGGLLGLLWRVYNGQSCLEIIETKLNFLHQIGLLGLLTIGRQNGLQEIEKHIKKMAKSNQSISKY